MPDDDLLARIAEYQKSQAGQGHPGQPLLPLPPGVSRASLTPDQQEQLFTAWTAEIDSRPSSTWSAADRQAYQFAISRTLRTMGYR